MSAPAARQRVRAARAPDVLTDPDAGKVAAHRRKEWAIRAPHRPASRLGVACRTPARIPGGAVGRRSARARTPARRTGGGAC
ncbi:hypothetical protein SLNWT_2179 [Streptomyces albus]|uniref:Uncharacterized protein n=1 Tax=Streptomyces albus (strain ATCC 21838 / DSM 41398 / FERM P-419 / JCM 4703 / NBRC 107858) TaxID=1081613 RepID=A0A0B5ETH2_STRA4|nr:hypothetical protein SLNWT_2179 [Streptomyces albus]